MSKTVILAVGPCLKRDLMPAIKKALMVERLCRVTAACAVETFELTLHMKSMDTREFVRLLDKLVTKSSMPHLLNDDVYVGDAKLFWPRVQ